MVHTVSVASGVRGKAVAEIEKPAPWQMPRPTLGTVLWRHADGSGGECYAVVTAVYGSMIEVLLFPKGVQMGRVVQGVKHVSDPSLKKMSVPNPGGVWDFCPGEKHMTEALKGAVEIIREQAETIARMREELRDIDLEGRDEIEHDE